MRIVANRRSVKADKNGYLYFTKHGLGPGTLPKDVKLLDWRDVDDNITAIWLDRFLTTKELNQYDIYPENSDQHKMYSKKLNSCTITASRPDNSYQHYYAYDYKGKNRFSIHYDDVTDIEDPELSFKQFRASVSPIKPYDDADYAWARIQNGSIDYFRKGKLIKKEHYFMFSDYGTDEDGLYEDANDWMNDVINKACDTLIDLNQNVEPVIIHNSKSIQSATANNEYRVDDITASTVLDMNPEFRNNFEEAVDFFYEDYPATVELTDEVDEDYDTLYKAYVKEIGSLYQQTPGIVYIDINWDSGEILQALQETAEAIGLQEYNTFYSSIESSDYESDSGIFMEDIIDSLKDNGYDLSRIRSIRKGLLELFGYKGKDADIIIHDLVAGEFIDPNDWVDKDYTPGIYSATNDGEGYWFFTTHGVQPGSVPRDVDILDIIDTPNGSFVKFDRFLSTKELNYYDMVEKAPKSVMSSKESDVRLGDTVEYNGDLYVIIDDESDLLTLRPQSRFSDDDFDDPESGDCSEDVFLAPWQLAKNQKVTGVSEEDEEDLPMVDQEYDSAATSINSNKLPAI